MNGGQFITTLYYTDCAAYVAEIDAVASALAQAYPTMDGPTRAAALQSRPSGRGCSADSTASTPTLQPRSRNSGDGMARIQNRNPKAITTSMPPDSPQDAPEQPNRMKPPAAKQNEATGHFRSIAGMSEKLTRRERCKARRRKRNLFV